MKKLLSKARSTLQEFQETHTTQNPAHSTPPQITPPTPTDLLRYRYHHGTNLGSIFVLEQWLHGSMFPSSSPSGSELDAVSTSLAESGLEETRQKWEQHWASALTDHDLTWLVNESRCTSIRLPIGYFTLGAEFCVGTPFEKVGGVYEHAWDAVVDLIRRARSYGVGVLLDLHALPGGANGEAHSGTSSGKAGLWDSRRDLERAKGVLVGMAERCLKEGLGLVGLQVCNEAVWDARGMWDWYGDVLEAVGWVDPSVPVYVSDGWDLGRAVEWVGKMRGGNPVVVDTHRYFTFSDKDRSQSPQQIIGRIGGELGEIAGKEVQVVVGEWSCVLDGQTWGRVPPDEKDGLVREFGQAQCRRWEEASGGGYFWTYKMEWMDGGEWGFVEQTKKGNITSPAFLALPAQEVRNRTQAASVRREEMRHNATSSHEEYWNRTSPGKNFEHHLYGEGWDLGFSDAQRFFSMRADGALGDKAASVGGDKIGCLDIWAKKRLQESGRRGEFVWEWNQGFRAGFKAFENCVGI